MEKKVGIIFADSMEYEPFLALAKARGGCEDEFYSMRSVSLTQSCDSGSADVTAVECGIGKVRAACAAALLFANKGCEIIINAGLSGAVSGLRREDVVAGREYIECDFDLSAIGYPPAARPNGEDFIHKADEALLSLSKKAGVSRFGRLGTGDFFLSDPEKRDSYKRLFDICAFDMESAAIAAVCARCSVAFLSLRKISDDAGDCSGEDYRQMNERAEASLSELVFRIIQTL